MDNEVQNDQGSDKIKTLKDEVNQLIHNGLQTQSDLLIRSRLAEDSVRSFLKEQKDRLDDLAAVSIKQLRDLTDRRLDSIVEGNAKLLEVQKTLSGTNCSDQDILDADQLVHAQRNTNHFERKAINFEPNEDIHMSVHSSYSLGSFDSNRGLHGMQGICGPNEETMRKEPRLQCWFRTRCMMVDEHSWATNSISSLSDNEIYEMSTPKGSCLAIKSSENDVKSSVLEEKILNVTPDGKPLARRLAEFVACKHRTPCVISDLTLLPNMNIVLLDHYHNSIQLFDENYTQLDEKWCQYPMGSCRFIGNTIIVSLRRNSQLAFFEVKDNKLNHQRTIRVQCESYLWQVKYRSQCIFVVCDENNIHMLDSNGIEYGVIRSGVAPECGYLRYFDFNAERRNIYLSERRGLRCVDFQGKLQWLFTTEDFPEKERDKYGHTIEDVCYYEGNILGTHWTMSRVFQISTSGQFLRNLILDDLEHPRIMSILGKQLVVTQFHPCMNSVKRRTVKVFELDL